MSNAIGHNDGSIRFVKLAACELASSTACDLLCKRPIAWMQDSVYLIITLICAYSVGIRWDWVGRSVHNGLIIHCVLTRALRSLTCIKLAITTLQAYGPSLNTVALSTFCAACGMLTKAAILDELELSHGKRVVGMFWVCALVCLLSALGAPARASYILPIAQSIKPALELFRHLVKFR
ncbi:MAG: hypothetical protein AAI978_00920 [Candidatus Hodgkinia cicadicola]